MLHKDAILQINFGYTQLLFMGSVPRINCHLVNFLYVLHITVIPLEYTSLWFNTSGCAPLSAHRDRPKCLSTTANRVVIENLGLTTPLPSRKQQAKPS
jgi:hypothetical protein